MRLRLLLLFSLPMLSHAATPLAVMLDPGHGGRDRGACRAQVQESEITLKVALKLKEKLQRDKRFKVFMTRQTDEKVTLSGRTQRALQALDEKARAQGAIFLSVHVNSSPDAHARGAEFYFQNQLPPDEDSMYLAHQENEREEGEGNVTRNYDFVEHAGLPTEVSTIVTDLLDGDRVLKSSQLSKALKRNWHGSKKSKTNSVRQAPFFVLSQLTIPSSLVELGFLTNGDDARDLVNPAAQERMADDLYRGLIEYKESMDKQPRGT